MNDDPIWRCMDSSKPLRREQLEMVIHKKKINEIVDWFEQHFRCDASEYLNRCPIVLFQGPTGCGKTSTIRYISHELKIPIKEYSETSDITALNYDLSRSYSGRLDEELNSKNSSLAIDRRKAQKFEHFVINNIRYQTLYSTSDDDAAAEFYSDSDDEFGDNYSLPCLNSSHKPLYKQPSPLPEYKRLSPLPKSRPPPPKSDGVIIHVESPLTFARSQRVFLHSIQRILKILRDMSNLLRRRVAIVFETLEEGESIALPVRVKQSLKIQVFKFNSVTMANMKKLVEFLLEHYNIMLEKDTMKQLINDSNGDIRACLNTLQLICYKSSGNSEVLNKKSINYNSTKWPVNDYDLMPVQQVNKKQKLIHDRFIRINKLNSSLMRDSTGGVGFFHVLGKIFYQKRLYPEPSTVNNKFNNSNGVKLEKHNSLERPYAREYSSGQLVEMIDVEPKNLITWLHHHYYSFCKDSDIEKAALFLENISSVDTVSIGSTLSTQFYESRGALDQLQLYLSIESTTFSLYEDQSENIKSSHKKVTADRDSTEIIKSSVICPSTKPGELYSFKKPTLMSLYKVVEDVQKLLDCCTTKLVEAESLSMNPISVLLDYVPYLSRTRHSLLSKDESLSKIVDTIERIGGSPNLDYEATHEMLQDLINQIE